MANEIQEIVEDFSLGLNNLLTPNKIDKRSSPTCKNVNYFSGALAKRNGSTAVAMTIDTFGAIGVVNFFGFSLYETNLLISALDTQKRRALFIAGYVSQNGYPSIKYTIDGTNLYDLAESTGTVDVTLGSAAVVGHGTSWSTRVLAGDLFEVNTGGPRYRVLTVNSDTSITLASNYAGANSSGQAYSILVSFPAITATSTVNSRIRFISMNSTLYIVSSYGFATTVRSWTGSTLALVSAFPNAKYVTSLKNYIFAANTSANPSRVSWSALKDPTTWPASNFVDVNPDDGEDICGLFSDQYSLIILKRKSAYRLTGDAFDPANPTYVLSKISTPSDFFADNSRSVNFFKGVYIFKGAYGLYQWDGNVISKLESSKNITTTWNGLFSPSVGNTSSFGATSTNDPTSAMAESSGIVYKDDYIFTAQQNSDGAITRITLDRNGAYWQYFDVSTASDVSDFAYFNGSLYGVNPTQQYLLKLDTGAYDHGDGNMNGTWTSKVFEYANKQQFVMANVFYKKQSAGNLTFEYSIDEGSFTSATIDMTAGSGTRVKSENIIIGQSGRTIQFRVSNFTIAQTFELYAIELTRRDLKG